MSDSHTTPIVIKGFRIDPKLLERKAITRCEISRCKGSCCSDGVWLDVAQAQNILDHAAMIQPFMRPERRDTSQWFAELHDDDPSFPSGKYTGTTTVHDATHPNGGTCIFLRPEDRYCAIQAACIANKREAWSLKPLYCCLFPVVDEYEDGKTLTMDDENDLFHRGGGCFENCAGEPVPMFQLYAEEVALMLGVDGYRELCKIVGEQPRL